MLSTNCESDSQEVVDSVNAKKSFRAEIFWVASKIQNRMKRLNQVTVQYTPRGCNTLAHSLIRLALELNDFVFWVDNIPSDFLYLFTQLDE